MLKKEFLESSGNIFRAFGCKQYKRKFVYDHEDMYITFFLIRSNYSEAYYFDFNCTIKALHPGIKPSEILEKDFDFILYPRWILLPKMIPLQLDLVDVQKYEKILKKELERFLKKVNKKGLRFLKEYGRGHALGEKAEELLSKY
ncbi:MAG: hypothetical protein LBV13_06085 [Methanomassiliicoccaceae archaeon]|jgi:hypothetical protein|nr:hypothetical protein [Methanomassiliicoccaceae archaeon]